MLLEVGVAGATVADVARRHDLTRQHIYQWRRELRRKGMWPRSDGAVFLPVEHVVEELDQTPDVEPEEALRFEIVLGNSRTLRCNGQIEDDALVRLIRLVEAA
ncbi:transposase [Tranquillimonas rosea]|uniref:Transposase n=2 Tax=Tranquillimonas rosea TaxID=641238 RepID=A0A1H9PM33_9RHOB|nr:transposase [Tranquillimonas rosea]